MLFNPYVLNNKEIEKFSSYAKKKFEFQFYNFPEPLEVNDNIALKGFTQRDKYRDSSILLLGGGPSTIQWIEKNPNKINQYDYIWSLNHFFKNELIANLPIDLVILSPEVNLLSLSLSKYLKNNKELLIGFESREKWLKNRHKDFLNKKFIKNKKCFAMMTKFNGKIGGCARMLILAGELKANNISFIGMDGIPTCASGQHSFEEGKISFPAGVNKKNAHIVCKEHYDELWKYMKINYSSLKMISLQDNNLYHKACNI